MSRRAVFFDRDDTLMVNVPYLGDPRLVEPFAEAAEALAALAKKDFLLFVVSNQSGVGRGGHGHRSIHAGAGGGRDGHRGSGDCESRGGCGRRQAGHGDAECGGVAGDAG